MARLAKIPGIADLESSEKGANPTVAVRINNELASDLGLTTARIGNALRPLIAGDQISTWLGPDGQDYDVIVQLPKQRREIAADLGDLYVEQHAHRRERRPDARAAAPGGGVRRDRQPAADQAPQPAAAHFHLRERAKAARRATSARDAEKIVKAMKLPQGYRFDVGGGQQEMNETFSAALAALGLAVIFIYLVLASQFGSFMQPIAIMVSLPLSLIGVLLALLFTGTTLNIFSIIGFIMLMGLVTKNAILLVDFTNQALRAGQSLREAILEAGQVRLRPILMTTLAMIFGMLPMAIGVGAGRRDARADGTRRDRRRDHLDGADAADRAGAVHVPVRARRARQSGVQPQGIRKRTRRCLKIGIRIIPATKPPMCARNATPP